MWVLMMVPLANQGRAAGSGHNHGVVVVVVVVVVAVVVAAAVVAAEVLCSTISRNW